MQLNLSAHSLKPADMAALGRQFPKAASSALNRTVKQAKTQASTLVRERYNLKKSDLDRNIKVKNSSASTLQAALKVSGRRQPLIDFGARQTAQGVSVAVVKAERKVIRTSFIPKLPSGHKGVFLRFGPKVRMQKGRYAGTNVLRQRIGDPRKQKAVELTGPGVPGMFSSTQVYGKLKQFVQETLPKNLASAINFLKK